MSLFRPDRDFHETEFIPLGFDSSKNGFVSDAVISGRMHAQANTSDASASGVRGAGFDASADPSNPLNTSASADAMHHLTAVQLEAVEAAAYARGEAAAQQEAVALAGACAAIEKAGLELARTAASELAANREETLGLAAEMARLWVGDAIRTDASLFGDLIESVLVEVDAAEDAQVFLNPEALAAFAAHEGARRESWSEKFGVSLLSDASLAPDDFRVETPIHRVDGRTEAIRDRLINALSGAIEAAPPEGAQ